jgi:glutamate dehydrogenase (NAD(P)+)
MPVEVERVGQQTIHRVSRDGRPLGLIAIDSTVSGRARGGLRLVADVSEPEVRAAARTMTLKYGFLGFAHGGAKAGVRGDDESSAEEKRAILRAFAAEAAALLRDRTYIPDADLGTSAADIRAMLAATGLPAERRERRGVSGLYTAYSVLGSLRALLAHVGEPLAGLRVAIEGFGSVGTSLARLLGAAGARIVAVSTSRGALYDPRGLDVARLLERYAQVGSRLVESDRAVRALPRESLLELPVDLLAPCARFHGISAENADRVRAKWICGGANDPISPEAAALLFARGVLVVPDFVSNCGGVLGGTLEFFGVGPERIRSAVIGRLEDALPPLLREASRQRVPVRAVVEPLALARHRAARSAAEEPTPVGRILSSGLELYRRGLLPQRAVAPWAGWYLGRLSRRPPRSAAAERQSRAEERRDWDSVGARWIAEPPHRLWRDYCDHLNEVVLGPWLAERARERVLKTDLFDEAIGRHGLMPMLGERTRHVVGLDVSERIARAARQRQRERGLRAIIGDVRALPLRDGSFDAVVSNSTLDHFASLDEIALALREAHRVLAPGGELLLTLDNGANPVVALRGWLPIAALRRTGLVPYHVGATCGPRRLRRLLAESGFAPGEIGAAMHVPRLPAVWLFRAVDRAGGPAARRRFIAAAAAWDRLAGLPTRYLSGYFLVVRARKPGRRKGR